MTDSRSREKSLRELEFNDLNIHLYLTLNHGTASEHLDFDFMVLYNAFVLSWGLTITQNSIHTISDLDRSRLSDTRSAENDRIGADTDPEYRIDASLVQTGLHVHTAQIQQSICYHWIPSNAHTWHLHIQLMYNLLHLCILLCVYICVHNVECVHTVYNVYW